ncbi:MAG TPA: adenosylcobinamide amidohydrolase [Nitrospiraceae bacterium]|nr:adenosylcobinamide amidohydrolase [Nitrospiraceae bacterium]
MDKEAGGGHCDALVTCFDVKDQTLVIDLGTPRRVLSSAPRLGGLVMARSILNHQVPEHFVCTSEASGDGRRRWRDPSRYLGLVAETLSAPQPCIGLMTAVLMRRLIVLREQWENLWVEGFFTVGVTNAVRAGEPTVELRTSPAGTINIILVTNAALSISAMVTLVQVITESKTASLLAQNIPSQSGRPGATGTGTDAVVVASGDEGRLRYSGTHTKIGELAGRLVMKGVTRGLTM